MKLCGYCEGRKVTKKQGGRFLLNLEHLSVFFLKNFNNELYKVPTGRLHVGGFERRERFNKQRWTLQAREGCVHKHHQIWAVKEGQKPIGAPLDHRMEHSQMWKSEVTHLHTVVQTPGRKKKKTQNVRRVKEWSKDLKLLEKNTLLKRQLKRWGCPLALALKYVQRKRSEATPSGPGKLIWGQRARVYGFSRQRTEENNGAIERIMWVSITSETQAASNIPLHRAGLAVRTYLGCVISL